MTQSLVHKHDISAPVSTLEPFIQDFLMKLKSTYHGFELFLFGHIGDGNMHINIRKPDSLSKEAFLEECKSIDLSLFELVKTHHGSVSAEHGIGLLKKNALEYSRTPVEIELMRKFKKLLDPGNLLNPGKIFD